MNFNFNVIDVIAIINFEIPDESNYSIIYVVRFAISMVKKVGIMTFEVLHFTCELNPKMGGIPSGLELVTTNLKSHGMNSTVLSFGNSKVSYKGAAPRITRMKESRVEVF